MLDVTAEQRPATVLQVIESTLGVLFAFLVGFVVVALGWVVLVDHLGSEFKWLVTGYGVAAVGEMYFLTWLKSSLERRLYPIAPMLALHQPRWHLLFRPIMAAWWAAHFVLAAGSLFVIERNMSLANLPNSTVILLALVFISAQFMLTNSAMLYLLLAVTAVARGEKLVWFVWRKRIVIDLMVMGAAALVALKWPRS